MTTSLKKTLIASLVVPAIALTAACTSGSNNDKSASPASSAKSDTGSSGGSSAQAPVPAEPPVDGITEASGDSGVTKDFSTSAQSLSRSNALAPEAASADAAGTDAADNAPDKTSPEVESASVISKGQISLHSKDIDAARFDLQKLLDTLNGTIDDEQSNANKAGKTIRQRLVLRVPSKYFSKAMDGISKLDGVKLVSRSRSSEDVTTQVIDNRTRIRTQRASIARIQALLAQASNLNQVISIESQLSRRQAQLDSLEAQQKYLADQTSMSTINVYLTVPSTKHAASHKKDHDFFSGLRSGWDHLGSSTNAVLTGIGAVLPFGVLAALVGFPAWGVWRRRTPKPVAEAAPAA
ncbi:DUF4349 domain-containing protein [Nocardioides marmorisolisilvae]|uniref:DUF4349 domain-containing protein n=1 Tax=Nocardioides marmorisolisilvae TaxID=1542737 RepID=A0A3N0DU14_9ACTN|nr:DUF4349 domain-containing protein [Nocardioides marmorisolisilvae]RNL79125.1 DUF4349 domain-containing protein [Nocardioides marmorisolisilvae]